MPKQGKGISLVHLKNTNIVDSKFNNVISGLVGKFYWKSDSDSGGYWNADPTFFSKNQSYFTQNSIRFTSTQIYGFYVDTNNISHTSNITSAQTSRLYYSVQWLGYFKAPATDNYTFKLLSDDGTALWIGNNAVSGFTLANATINDSPTQSAVNTLSSSKISLVAGQYYPIRIQFGNKTGPSVADFSYVRDSNSTPVYNMDGQLYHLTNQDFVD